MLTLNLTSKSTYTDYHYAVKSLAAEALKAGLVNGAEAQVLMDKADKSLATLAHKSAKAKATRAAKAATVTKEVPASYAACVKVLREVLKSSEAEAMTAAEVNAVAGSNLSALTVANTAKYFGEEFVKVKNAEGRSAYYKVAATDTAEAEAEVSAD